MDQINQFKEQIVILQLLGEEKQKMEIDYNCRHEFNMQAAARHRAEIDQLQNELMSCQNDQEQMEYLVYENQVWAMKQTIQGMPIENSLISIGLRGKILNKSSSKAKVCKLTLDNKQLIKQLNYQNLKYNIIKTNLIK